MACDGIAVLRAKTPDVNLAEHFADEANRQAFIEFVTERGFDAARVRWHQSYAGWQLELTNERVTLVFEDENLRLVSSRYNTSQDQRAKLLLAGQQYAGQVNQMNILATIQALGIQTQNFAYDTAGALSFEINL
jgi:hypothetical protein